MIKDNKPVLQEAIIASRIITLRNEKVILDVHLAELYEVETRALKQSVRRNIDRFPSDFMYELTDIEIDYLVSQNVIPSKGHLGGAIPFAFTENGVAMLSSILKSKKAIGINISIIRTFTILRKMMYSHKEILAEMEMVRGRLSDHDNKFLIIFEYLKQFEQSKQQELQQANRKRIGFKTDKSK